MYNVPRTGLKAQAISNSLVFVDFSLFSQLKASEKLKPFDDKMRTPAKPTSLRGLCEMGSSDEDLLASGMLEIINKK
ncbi:MAG TPA: hypothetical protein PLD24_10985 [Macellibacteroides fermentans]|nr:hypothetical protein [Macellibacteroides fermentans]